MVSLGGKYCISDIYINEPERVKAEVEELAKTTAVPDGLDKNEYLNRVWLYNEIKKSGGYAIFPHPFWRVCFAHHTQTSMVQAIFDNHLCDAFEILNADCGPECNNSQAMLYFDLCKKGKFSFYNVNCCTISYVINKKGLANFTCKTFLLNHFFCQSFNFIYILIVHCRLN